MGSLLCTRRCVGCVWVWGGGGEWVGGGGEKEGEEKGGGEEEGEKRGGKSGRRG